MVLRHSFLLVDLLRNTEYIMGLKDVFRHKLLEGCTIRSWAKVAAHHKRNQLLVVFVGRAALGWTLLRNTLFYTTLSRSLLIFCNTAPLFRNTLTLVSSGEVGSAFCQVKCLSLAHVVQLVPDVKLRVSQHKLVLFVFDWLQKQQHTLVRPLKVFRVVV